jgi:hypothetical protein
MKFEKKLRELCKSDIEVVKVTGDSVEVLLPYDSSSVDIEIEGETDEERIESFKEGVNYRLEQMINHLKDCKF